MNLADAIRKAAMEGSLPTVSQVPTAFQPQLVDPDANSVTVEEPNAYLSSAAPPEAPNLAVLGGNVVRIELGWHRHIFDPGLGDIDDNSNLMSLALIP